MDINWKPTLPVNDMDNPVPYAPGTPERKELLEWIDKFKGETQEIPLIIDGEEVTTGDFYEVKCPHDHENVLAKAHLAGSEEIGLAIGANLQAYEDWSKMSNYERAAIFYRAADMLAGPRRTECIASIMVNHSKNPYEAEVDLGELIDFWRCNAYYMKFIHEQQPNSIPGEFNRIDWRPLEGFVFAVPPFNFFAIGGNLPTAPAMMGNVALWKPTLDVLHSNYKIMEILMDAGLPKGVVNFVPFRNDKSDEVFDHSKLAGLHFTGSYQTFVKLWKKVSDNLENYQSFPRVVGETGGKDFIFVHPSARDDLEALVPNTIRAAYGYQGQKCSACSRLYIPQSMWDDFWGRLKAELPKIKVGPTEELENFMGALINENAFRKVSSYIEHAQENPDTFEVLYGGETDESKGWFVQPTVVRSHDALSKLMSEEIFGPVLTIYVYPDDEFERTLKLCDTTSPYALTGSIFAKDRDAVDTANEILRNAAGNFYINDKPTGSIPARQPFGGGRQSGTNDKAGFWPNLLRWTNPRSIKETRLPSTRWDYPFMG